MDVAFAVASTKKNGSIGAQVQLEEADMIHILMRISDAGNPKPKLPFATPLYCLDNCIHVFGKKHLHVFADNCSPTTLNGLRERAISPFESKLGNAGSFLRVLDFALEHFSGEDRLYFLEDDYLHLPTAPILLEEGLDIADYVTLYDHPDKYHNAADGGPNPFIREGGEPGRVLLTKSLHWKTTNSTTMTFAVKAKTLVEDAPAWKRFGVRVRDFDAFTFLQRHPKNVWDYLRQCFSRHPRRRLISSIPAASTHCELAFLAPLIPWNKTPSSSSP